MGKTGFFHFEEAHSLQRALPGPQSMHLNCPKPLKRAQTALVLHTSGVQIDLKSFHAGLQYETLGRS